MSDNKQILQILEIDYDSRTNKFIIYLYNSENDWYMEYTNEELKHLIKFLSGARKRLPKEKKR